MGVDIYPAIAHWDRVADTLNAAGIQGIWQLFDALPDWEVDEPDDVRLRWPLLVDSWYAECTFRGLGSTGSYKPHFFLGHLWEHARERPDMPADVVALFDEFIGRLVLGVPSARVDLSEQLPGQAELMNCFPPSEVCGLARLWRECSDRIGALRPVLAAQLIEDRWFGDVGQVLSLLQGWGDVLHEAERRGWGLFYLTS
ncbi:hypothetical protein GFY24_31885 [Nocardia sp. SYP-A9097]|uniref:hypothetical protein n=1 Tax=Nocardia sp. SYP-A9097 TaxID=2663237 RepID=UPI00129A5D41|nr:hypothetical protein [Nocardia sp. SYP-A9097]MRH91986.1 hypothetical protein [Nocardia sp. SYP-A9097]